MSIRKGEKVVSMTEKQKIFIREYLKDFNGTRAYKEAYNCENEDTARKNASRLLTNVDIRQEIEELSNKQLEELDITTSYIIRNIKEVAERCMQKTPVLYYDKEDKEYKQEKIAFKDEESGEIREEGVWQFDASNSLKALELLGKYKSIFKEKVEHSGNVKLTYEEALKKVEGNEY